jgi:hypothetical protein
MAIQMVVLACTSLCFPVRGITFFGCGITLEIATERFPVGFIPENFATFLSRTFIEFPDFAKDENRTILYSDLFNNLEKSC